MMSVQTIFNLSQHNIPFRQVHLALARVVNIKRHPELHQPDFSTYEYIRRGSYWGNPHSMHEHSENRDEVMRKYRYDFEYDKFINIDPPRVHDLKGKTQGCYCKPAPCHGDILAEFLNGYDDGL